MNDSGNTDASAGLNENPKMPDTSGLANPLAGANAGPSLTIANFVIKSNTTTANGESVEEKLVKARKDTSITG